MNGQIIEQPFYNGNTIDEKLNFVKCENPRFEKIKKKRSQVKMACVNCKKSCKKCANVRPCLRCIQKGIADTCIDIKRKPRRIGIKRGPYKKRRTWNLEVLALVCTQLLEHEENII
ncbi:hypothetical protein BCR36DRAFT_350771 [Piromyces finnis]|uniref:Zn(2)-C6 fungal-type domain-containing protein n=1 Tax=Piromyces finnis TaxID=1754191 RepID=A0A1Y1VBE3_9FUNG|nr:hypothetical protein BCR36DRAFT_350771 [Piromyces finnis]|eukprot:ORX51775.1 hypothetical protein BCR36DRAFT_350771 [Piromyces finnis]